MLGLSDRMKSPWLLSLLLTAHATSATLHEQLNATLHAHSGVGLVSYGVEQHGRVCGFTAVGERIRGTGEPMPADTRSRYMHGSVTKSMTTTLMAILMHDGTLNATWDSTLTTVLPSLATGTAYANVTLRQLVGMLSGMEANRPFWWAYEPRLQVPQLPDAIRDASQPTYMNGTLRERRLAATRDILRTEPLAPPGTSHECDLTPNAAHASPNRCPLMRAPPAVNHDCAKA